jgi:EmrB/QacA subfamily drug resistance transporter
VNRPPSDLTPTQRWVLGLGAVASLMISLDALVVLTALDRIRRALHAPLDSLEWTVNAYTLTFAVLLMPAAALAERYGRRRLLSVGIMLFTAASAVCAVSPNIGYLVAARAVQGTGAAAVMPTAMTLLVANIPSQRRAAALGLFASVTGLATLGAPVVGGALVEVASWQWIFWLNVPIGVALIPLIRRHVPESRGTAARVDFVGMVLVAAGMIGVMWALIRGNKAGWLASPITVALALGALCIVVFVVWELRTPAPLLPIRLFARRGFGAANAAAFTMFASLVGLVFWLAQYLQTVQHVGALGAGLRLAPMTLTLSVLAPWVGARINRVGERVWVTSGLSLQVVGSALLAWIAHAQLPYLAMVVPLLVTGAGASMVIPAAQSAVVAAAPVEAAGAASSTFNTLRQLGAAFGVAISSAVFAAAGAFAPTARFTDGFVAATAAVTALPLVGIAIATLMPSHSRAPAPRAESSPLARTAPAPGQPVLPRVELQPERSR